MPKLVNAVPKYRKHASGQAVVGSADVTIYLGKFGTKASKQEYTRRIAEWVAADRPATSPRGRHHRHRGLRAFLRYAQKHYVKRPRSPTRWPATSPAPPLEGPVRHTNAADFGPKGIKAIRDQMIAAGNSGSTSTSRCPARHLFKWAAAEELVPVEVFHRLAVVPVCGRARQRPGKPPRRSRSMMRSRCHAATSAARGCGDGAIPAADRGQAGRSLPHAALDIDRPGDVWRYVPKSIRRSITDRDRTIFIGPQAQEVLKPYLFGDDLPCFRAPRSPRGFNSRSYRDRDPSAVERANKDRLKHRPEPLPTWHPNQLRHACRHRDPATVRTWKPHRWSWVTARPT